MKLSDRDKKLILFVLLVAIIALPIVFFIKPRNDKIKEMGEELVSVNERYNYLKELSLKQSDYEQKIVELNTQRDEMIKLFPGGILKENTIMFLRNIEISVNPMWFYTVSFEDIQENPITDAEVKEGEYVEGLTAVKLETTVNFEGNYEDVKALLDTIFANPDKMIVSSVYMEAQTKSNKLKGTLTFDQFAITGAGNEIKNANIPEMLHGNERIFPYKEELEENQEEENQQ